MQKDASGGIFNVCAVSGYWLRIFLVVNGVYVPLAVAIDFLLVCGPFSWFCWGNVVSIVRILWSWTYLHIGEGSWVGAVVGKFGYH